MSVSAQRRRRWVRYWDSHAHSYDRQMELFDRVLFRDTRAWICRQARGEVLEVAIGTGLNLAHYPPGTTLTGIELSEQMLAVARERAADLSPPVRLRPGNAESLEFADAGFDTVVCTFSLCAIPDHRRAVTEMVRVLRPGGLLLLADHVVSTSAPVGALQRLMELVSVPLGGEHLRRRPLELVRAAGLTVPARDRFALGLVERLVAVKR